MQQFYATPSQAEQQLLIPHSTRKCVGQLKALNVETIVPTYDWDAVSGKHQQILSNFSTIDW
jgi:hypothetical protein